MKPADYYKQMSQKVRQERKRTYDDVLEEQWKVLEKYFEKCFEKVAKDGKTCIGFPLDLFSEKGLHIDDIEGRLQSLGYGTKRDSEKKLLIVCWEIIIKI